MESSHLGAFCVKFSKIIKYFSFLLHFFEKILTYILEDIIKGVQL